MIMNKPFVAFILKCSQSPQDLQGRCMEIQNIAIQNRKYYEVLICFLLLDFSFPSSSGNAALELFVWYRTLFSADSGFWDLWGEI